MHSVQDSIYALPKAHLLATTSLRSFANVAFETVHVSADDKLMDSTRNRGSLVLAGIALWQIFAGGCMMFTLW